MAIFHKYNAREDCFEPVQVPPDFIGAYRPLMLRVIAPEVRAKFGTRKSAPRIAWDAEKDARLAALYDKRLTYDQLAKALGCSRSACHCRLMALADEGRLTLRTKAWRERRENGRS